MADVPKSIKIRYDDVLTLCKRVLKRSNVRAASHVIDPKVTDPESTEPKVIHVRIPMIYYYRHKNLTVNFAESFGREVTSECKVKIRIKKITKSTKYQIVNMIFSIKPLKPLKNTK